MARLDAFSLRVPGGTPDEGALSVAPFFFWWGYR